MPNTSSAEQDPPRESVFAVVARLATKWSGSTPALSVAALTVVAWGVSGTYFRYSDTWQLVINTGTTVVTFLMVFLIRRSQNKDSQAIHLKLNELVAATKGASNRLINSESLTEEELVTLHAHFCTLVRMAKEEGKLTASHSIEEAVDRHEEKAGKSAG